MSTKICKRFLGLVILLGTLSVASAQDNNFKRSTPEERARFQTEWMKKQLSLDTVVVSRVYEINLKYAEKMQAAMRADGSRENKRSEMKALSDARDAELEKVLTPEQYKLYLQKKEDFRQHRKQNADERRKNKDM